MVMFAEQLAGAGDRLLFRLRTHSLRGRARLNLFESLLGMEAYAKLEFKSWH